MNSRRRFLLAFVGAMALGGIGAAPDAAFCTPPKESRPETWFHFIGGNVAKPGITADLEAINGAGISGVQLFHGQFGGPWPGVSPQITCLSKPWDGLVGFVADECQRLGLRFTMQNCPGWAMSGGPWIKPENAMRHLTWSRTDVEGGRRVEVKLPRSGGNQDWRAYRDVAVLAFPATAGDWNRAIKATVSSDLKDLAAAWQNGKSAGISTYSVVKIVFDFEKPETVRTVEFPSINSLGHGWCYEPQTTVTCEANGRVLFERELPAANWQDDRPVTFAIDETTTKQLVLTIKNKHDISLGKVHLFSSARNDDWEAQAGWTLRRLMRNPPAKQSEAAWVKSADVKILSGCMKPDGTFAWDAPAGNWAILRVGHVNTGAKNGPAPKEGTGFECDKLSPKGANIQVDNYIGRITGNDGPAKGKMANMLMDSWECRRQTWTDGLDKMFAKCMGYDIFAWMPAIFGYVVDSPEMTARFLNDWRGFIGELVSENFYAQMAKRCHERGMTISFETSFGDVLPGDVMKYYKHADTPMCEFWQPRQNGYVGSHNFKPVRPTVSAAHVYGKKSVAAEALTSFALTWDEKLRDLKYVANIHMAMGVSHLVFHTYTHNPRTDWLPPGTSFGSRIGTPFLRGQTWWKFMPDFTAYLARCQVMLEAGLPVNDVLWHLGDEWDHKPDEDAAFPAGHSYDYCNPDAFLNRFTVSDDGLWQTPDGTSYRVLWMPTCKRLAPETLEHLRDCVTKGGVAAMASLPQSSATLAGGKSAENFFFAARKALADLAASNQAKGRLYIGRPLNEVLAAEKIAVDVDGEDVLWNHRRSENDDWYFITPARQNIGFQGSLSFRAEGEVEIWSPETGRSVKAPVASAKNGRTTVALSLAPHESCFVVFRRGKKAEASIAAVEKGGKSLLAGKGGAKASAVKVIEARYGDLDADRWIDVREILQAELDANKTRVGVNNSWARGDPALHTVKRFKARLRLPGGEEKVVEAREGGTVELPHGGVVDSVCDIVGGRLVAFENGAYGITGADGSKTNAQVKDAAKSVVAGPWRLTFPEGWGMPGIVTLDSLKPWKEIGATPEARAFSGTAVYETEFTVGALDPGAVVVLDLGRVESLAQVEVNGKKFDDVWSYPYRLDVTCAVKEGSNKLKVSVTDTWFNRLVYDAGQPEEKRRTWTIAGPSANAALRDSGLIGPVRILRGRAPGLLRTSR